VWDRTRLMPPVTGMCRKHELHTFADEMHGCVDPQDACGTVDLTEMAFMRS